MKHELNKYSYAFCQQATFVKKHRLMLKEEPWSLRTLCEEFKKFAIKEYGYKTPEYNEAVGAFGEVLAMIWLYLFGYQYHIANIVDTSEDKYRRGFDLLGTYVNSPHNFWVQVKLFISNPQLALTDVKLFTMTDEMQKHNAAAMVIVPSSIHEKREEGLSFINKFNKRTDIIFIGQPRMTAAIQTWDHPEFGKSLEGFWNFYRYVVREIHEKGSCSPNLTCTSLESVL